MISLRVLSYYEFCLKLALPLAMVLCVLQPVSDFVALYNDWLRSQVPYGILWVWLNPLYWTKLPYEVYVLAVIVVTTGVNWYFVRKGRMTKLTFYLGWITSIIWMRTSVYQNVTVTAFAPLSTLFPPLVALLVLQKLPVGWSWPLSANAHWQCAFSGTQPYSDLGSPTGLMCSSPAVRWDLALPYVYSYALLVFWCVYPVVVWYLKYRKRGMIP